MSSPIAVRRRASLPVECLSFPFWGNNGTTLYSNSLFIIMLNRQSIKPSNVSRLARSIRSNTTSNTCYGDMFHTMETWRVKTTKGRVRACYKFKNNSLSTKRNISIPWLSNTNPSLPHRVCPTVLAAKIGTHAMSRGQWQLVV